MGSIQTEPPIVFSTTPQIHSFHGILFDFDGTLIDSTSAIVKNWHRLGAELGVDPAVILATSHGRRSIDVLKLYDATKANWPYVSAMEGRIPRDYGHDAVEVGGARALLASLDAAHAPWAVVTSGTRALVEGWLGVLALARPRHLVVAEDVEAGKPDPACYRLGKTRLLGLQGGDDAAVLVVEDAPSGIRAGKAAGFMVLALLTTHTLRQVREAGADWVVEDLRDVRLRRYEGGVVEVEIRRVVVEEE